MRAAAAAIAGGAAAAALYVALRRRRKTDDARITKVLDFWFKGESRGRKLWLWRQFRRERRTFSERPLADVVEEALSGKLEHWRRTPRGSIALVVVLDQLSRHVHRDRTTPLLRRGPAEVRDDFWSRWDPMHF